MTTWLDVKLGVRMLVKYPGLTLTGVAGIAVAVAIAAGGFSFIHGNFTPSSLPLEEGERIVSIELWDPVAGKPEARSLYYYHVWREGLRTVKELSAFRTITPNLILPGAQAASIRGALISASGFGVARVRPLLGRLLVADDEREGAPAVVVIGEGMWRDRLGGDPAIVGRTIQLGTASYTVAGVMPRGFAFPVNHQFWAPLRVGIAPAERLAGPALMVFGRLAPGATLKAAQAELTATGERTAKAFPKVEAPVRPRVMPFANPFLGLHDAADVRGLLVTQGVCVMLLVLVCLNVAILVYTRTATRQTEIGVRTALGASRGRIVGQLFVEALVLSMAGATVGVGIAAFALRQVEGATAGLAGELPFWLTFRLMPEAVVYAVGLSVLAAAIVGVIPGLQATRRGVAGDLRVAGAGGGGIGLGKTWTGLIVAQVGFAVALLPPAVSSTWEDTRDGIAGVGFAAEEYLSAELGMDVAAGMESSGEAGARAFTRRFGGLQAELMRRLEAEPGVAGVTFSMAFPGNERTMRVEAEGLDLPAQVVRVNRVGAEFLRLFEVPVLAGRTFTDADTAGVGEAGTVVVNQTLAQRMFGGNALGRRLRYAGGEERWYEIAGVVRDFPEGVSPKMDEAKAAMYHPVAAGQVLPATLAIRIRGGKSGAFTQRLREVAADVDADLHLRQIRGLDEALRSEQWITRMQAAATGAVTLSVLMLASAGIYALMSFTVSQRRKEIGIRMALGADWRRIVASIFSRALWQLAAGAAVGTALGAGMERSSGGELMRGNGPVVLPAVAVAMVVVGVLAALGPARRSLRIEPVEALREQ